MKRDFWYKLLVPFLVMILMLTVSFAISCNGTEGEQEEEETGEQEEEEEEEEEESALLVDPIATDAGLVSGTVAVEDGAEVHVYKSIPFAAPPVGDLRWKPPQPVEPWEGILECTEFAPIAPQSVDYELTAGQEQSEDCLYLNVYTPAQNTTDLLPVFVNIHGGAMTVGSSHSPDMTYFSRTNNVVSVSIAYRLGELGFMAHPLLSEESENDVSGNYGLMDQIAALEWVQTNIAAFGGDPDNVTIYGCSSGGESVLFLMASPFSEGLFHQAIADAGVYGSSRTPPLADMEAWGEELADNLGVSDEADVLAALRSISAEEIIEAGGDELPNVDGWFLPDLPLSVFEAGDQQNVPLMIGSGSADLAGDWNQYGDKNFACAMSTVSSPVYTWIFDHAPCGSGGGTHCLDMAYLFYDVTSREGMCDIDVEVAEDMVAMWVQFTRTGNPNVSGLIEWPAYEEANDQYLKIGDPFEVKTGLYSPTEEEEEVEITFTTYTNTEYGFSLQYPDTWLEKTDDPALGVTWRFGSGTYRIPAVRLIVLDESEGANLEEAFTAVMESDDKTLDSITTSSVNIHGTDFTRAEVTYTGASGAYDSLIIGFVRGSQWIIIESYTISLFPYPYEGLQEEIINSVTFE